MSEVEEDEGVRLQVAEEAVRIVRRFNLAKDKDERQKKIIELCTDIAGILDAKRRWVCHFLEKTDGIKNNWNIVIYTVRFLALCRFSEWESLLHKLKQSYFISQCCKFGELKQNCELFILFLTRLYIPVGIRY